MFAYRALLGLMVVLASTASAQTEFTVIVEDGGDNPAPWWDLVTVEIAHDAENLYLRASTSAAAPNSGLGTVFFGFTVGGTAIVSGYNLDGTPDTRNIGEPIPPAECTVEDVVGTCRYPFADIGASLGGDVTQIYAFMDGCAPGAGCVPVDNAPGLSIDEWQVTSDAVYNLACGGPVVCAATLNITQLGTVEGDLGTGHAQVEHSFTNHTTGTFVYDWTNDNTTLPIFLDATVENGTFAVSLVDEFDLEVYNATGNASIEDAITFDEAYDGAHTLRISFTEFQGALTFEVGQAIVEILPVDEPDDEGPRDNRQTAFPTQQATEPLPAPAAWLAMLALIGLAFARRQRA